MRVEKIAGKARIVLDLEEAREVKGRLEDYAEIYSLRCENEEEELDKLIEELDNKIDRAERM